MNFLAHLHLSGNDPNILVGNFIGDFVKGKQVESYEPGIAKGIFLHRAIDYFTDKHQIVAKSKGRLRDKYRHYSGVIIDIFYDHFLASNWGQYHSKPLDKFAEEAYDLVLSYEEILPEKALYILPYMMKNNWLVSYARIEGISTVLYGMSKRTKFHSRMEEATKELEEYYELFQKEFEEFYPELVNHSATFLAS